MKEKQFYDPETQYWDYYDFEQIYGDSIDRNCPILTMNPMDIAPLLVVARSLITHEAENIQCTGALQDIPYMGPIIAGLAYVCRNCPLRIKGFKFKRN